MIDYTPSILIDSVYVFSSSRCVRAARLVRILRGKTVKDLFRFLFFFFLQRQANFESVRDYFEKVVGVFGRCVFSGENLQ